MSTRLFVGNLSYATTEEELRTAFSQSGRTVESVRVAMDRQTQRPRGFAFIEMAKEQDADSAIKELNQSMVGGRTIFVEKAQDRPPAGGARPGGGFAPRSGPGPRPGDRPGYTPGGPGAGPPRPRPPHAAGGFGRIPGGPGSFPPSDDAARRNKAAPVKRKVKEKRAEGRPEQRERGKWRWDREEDY